jgi:hypothetical protein
MADTFSASATKYQLSAKPFRDGEGWARARLATLYFTSSRASGECDPRSGKSSISTYRRSLPSFPVKAFLDLKSRSNSL